MFIKDHAIHRLNKNTIWLILQIWPQRRRISSSVSEFRPFGTVVGVAVEIAADLLSLLEIGLGLPCIHVSNGNEFTIRQWGRDIYSLHLWKGCDTNCPFPVNLLF